MSVAFRRDGDDEHLEPRFAIPIPPGPNLVTPRGKAQIDEQVRRFADLAESAVDEPAKASAQRDLRYWQTRQITAEVMAAPAGNRVAFGTRVAFTLNGQSRSLTITGSDEAAGASDLLSFTAPLARALIGAEVGDLLAFGGTDDALEVLEITVPVAGPARSSP